MDKFSARRVVDSPRIEGSEDVDESRIVDAIVRTDCDQPAVRQRTVAPTPAPALPRDGGVLRRFLDGFRYRLSRPWPTNRAGTARQGEASMTQQQRALVAELRAADYPAAWKLSASASDDKLVASAATND
jgi:hypothetical protein